MTLGQVLSDVVLGDERWALKGLKAGQTEVAILRLRLRSLKKPQDFGQEREVFFCAMLKDMPKGKPQGLGARNG
jgi:hypothetical protein